MNLRYISHGLGTPLTTHATARSPTPPRAYLPPDRDAGRGRGGRDNDCRHDRRGRGGHGTVHFDTKDKGTPCRTDVITPLSINCGGTDINNTYRQCLVSIRPSTTFFTALTLFNTGAYISFVNREVAKCVTSQHILYYCTYYSVSLSCTVYCTYYAYCTLYI
jgi:hypothetical protein